MHEHDQTCRNAAMKAVAAMRAVVDERGEDFVYEQPTKEWDPEVGAMVPVDTLSTSCVYLVNTEQGVCPSCLLGTMLVNETDRDREVIDVLRRHNNEAWNMLVDSADLELGDRVPWFDPHCMKLRGLLETAQAMQDGGTHYRFVLTSFIEGLVKADILDETDL